MCLFASMLDGQTRGSAVRKQVLRLTSYLTILAYMSEANTVIEFANPPGRARYQGLRPTRHEL